MSFSSDDERIFKKLMCNDDISRENEESDNDEFDFNINSNIFPTDANILIDGVGNDDLDIDGMIRETLPTETPSCNLFDQTKVQSLADFSIRKEVKKYEKAYKSRIKKSKRKFIKVFKPVACSTPISFDSHSQENVVKQKEKQIEENPETKCIEYLEKQDDNVPKAAAEVTWSSNAMSIDLLTSMKWNAYPAPPSIAPCESTKRSVATPFLCPNVSIEEYSASSSIIRQNIFFSQLQDVEKISQSIDVMERIEKIVESLVEDLCCEKTLAFHVRDTRPENVEVINDIVKMKPNERANLKTINFYNKVSAGRYCLIVVLLGEVYKLLKTNTVCNKREIYYRNTQVIKDMRNLQMGIKDMCSLLQISTWEVGIVATAKGLVCGPLRIIMDSNDVIDCGAVTEGTLLPHNFNAMKRLETTAKFVLVVEKDTVFERFLKDDIFSRLGIPFILVTGKGVPDTCTRFFLKRIWDELKIPIYILVDADPCGIEIMLTYRHGSVAMCQQADYLAIPSIKWIGIYPSDLDVFEMSTLPLKEFDMRKIKNILNRSYLLPQIAQEVNILREKGIKAEIEGLYSVSDNYIIDDYLAQKLKDNAGI